MCVGDVEILYEHDAFRGKLRHRRARGALGTILVGLAACWSGVPEFFSCRVCRRAKLRPWHHSLTGPRSSLGSFRIQRVWNRGSQPAKRNSIRGSWIAANRKPSCVARAQGIFFVQYCKSTIESRLIPQEKRPTMYSHSNPGPRAHSKGFLGSRAHSISDQGFTYLP